MVVVKAYYSDIFDQPIKNFQVDLFRSFWKCRAKKKRCMSLTTSFIINFICQCGSISLRFNFLESIGLLWLLLTNFPPTFHLNRFNLSIQRNQNVPNELICCGIIWLSVKMHIAHIDGVQWQKKHQPQRHQCYQEHYYAIVAHWRQIINILNALPLDQCRISFRLSHYYYLVLQMRGCLFPSLFDLSLFVFSFFNFHSHHCQCRDNVSGFKKKENYACTQKKNQSMCMCLQTVNDLNKQILFDILRNVGAVCCSWFASNEHNKNKLFGSQRELAKMKRKISWQSNERSSTNCIPAAMHIYTLDVSTKRMPSNKSIINRLTNVNRTFSHFMTQRNRLFKQ